MKLIITLVLTLFTSYLLTAQNITGQWNGVLKVQGTQLRLVLNISKANDSYIGTMLSPDQSAKEIPASVVTFENNTLNFTIENLRIAYEGKLDNDNIIVGNFNQGGQSFPLNFSKDKIEKEKLVRPQEPTKPFNYYSEDVVIENKTDNITLSGTLTLPSKNGIYAAVILISGSGPQNRDEELMGHKPFLVLSDYLTKNGIAVLRYDDRGTAKSTGNFAKATTADFATDVTAALAYLKTRKEINSNKIGLVGHSEGGLIAPIVASKTKDVAFVVLMAGTGISGDKILLLQQKLIGKTSGLSDEVLIKNEAINKKAFDIVYKNKNLEKQKIALTNLIQQNLKNNPDAGKPVGMRDEEYVNLQVNEITSPWMQFFIKYNPATALTTTKCPVLAINGQKDLQVPPKENIEAIKIALAKARNKNVIIKELPNLNHLFQDCTTGSPDEYAAIEQTISPIALTEILNFIKMQVK